MSNYPGNPALSDAVKDRVLSTFQQTLALYKQGRSDETVQGCGLILRMDPAFEPAKKLMEKTRNPAAPIDVDKLLGSASAAALAEAKAAMAARNFPKAIEITTDILTNDLMNEEARVLNEQAREKAEAAPFIDQFVKKADQAIAAGNITGARAGLEKIKSLDADDTAVARIEKAIGTMQQKPAASPSFVVDTPPPAAAAGRGKAQASDFGFTFEEDKAHESALSSFSFESPFSTDTGSVPPISPPSGFSFDSTAPKAVEAKAAPPAPPAGGTFSFDTPPPSPSPFAGGFSFNTPPPSPAAVPPSGNPGEFDFATASIETSPDDQKKVQEYLAEGDQALAAGDAQKAIDVWSRVFLIDVTNEAASERIEKAKVQRRAAEQEVEQLLPAATEAFNSGDRKTAREKFARVQQIDPANATAKEYLSKLTEVPVEGGAQGIETPFKPSPAPKPDIFADDPLTAESDLLVPPAPAAAPAPARKPAAAAKAKAAPAPVKRELPIKMIGVVAAVVVVAALGWFAWSRFTSKPAYDPAATATIFKEATVLAKNGQYDAAITMLQDVKPADPQHDRALTMIADLQHKKVQASETAASRPSAAAYQQALAAGKAAYEAHDYDAAKKSFDVAASVQPLPPDIQTTYQNVSQQVAKLEGAKQLFSEQKYQDALTNLQGLQQQDPQNLSIQRLIADAHFNQGALDLQNGQLPDAINEFDSVLKIDPSDDLAQRSKTLAERYNGQPKDLLFKIYVKYLPMRKVS